MINSFTEGWTQFAKLARATYNRWWNDACSVAKAAYQHQPDTAARRAFLKQCATAKKEFFAKKVEEMVKQRKPWEGTNWIKQRQMPKVPQLVENGKVLNDISQMFNKMHQQFAQTAALPVKTDSVNTLPQREECTWPLF